MLPLIAPLEMHIHSLIVSMDSIGWDRNVLTSENERFRSLVNAENYETELNFVTDLNDDYNRTADLIDVNVDLNVLMVQIA